MHGKNGRFATIEALKHHGGRIDDIGSCIHHLTGGVKGQITDSFVNSLAGGKQCYPANPSFLGEKPIVCYYYIEIPTISI
jgi:hypothetical protein